MWTFAGLCSHRDTAVYSDERLLASLLAQMNSVSRVGWTLVHLFSPRQDPEGIYRTPGLLRLSSQKPGSILLSESDSPTPVPHNKPFILTQVPPSGGNIEPLFLKRAAVEERHNRSLPSRFDLLMECVFTCAVYGVSQRSMTAPVSA